MIRASQISLYADEIEFLRIFYYNVDYQWNPLNKAASYDRDLTR